jgi:hypothetical protein
MVIEGVAAVFHGSVRQTLDLDVVAPMELENLRRLVASLQDLRPRFRMRPDFPVVTPDNHNLKGIKNLYLTTDLGPLDVLGELEGFGRYGELVSQAIEADLGPSVGTCKVLDLDTLIAVKRSVGREKDKLVALELERIRARLQGAVPPPKTPGSGPPPGPRA